MSLVSLTLLEMHAQDALLVVPRDCSRVVADLLELAHVPLLSSLADEANPIYARLLTVAVAVLHEQHKAVDILELDEAQF
jgi:hypothetical protein